MNQLIASFYLILVVDVMVCSVLVNSKNIPDSSVYNFPYYSRTSWNATPPTDTRPLVTPVEYVIIHHTYIPGACNTTDECKSSMRSMQNAHNSLGWGDIGYNFCVGGDGGAYEGRGWHTVGIHAGNANPISFGICLIGDWRVNLPPPRQLSTTTELIKTGVERNIIRPDYKLIGHSQASVTECPGSALLTHISQWEHYVPGKLELRHKE